MSARSLPRRVPALLLGLALLPLAAAAQTLGGGGTLATGSAGPDGAQGANAQLEHCDQPKGTIAVVEPQSNVIASLSRYGLGSPTQVLRMLVQQSNCFQVVERGAALNNMMQERALAQGGQLQQGANIGGGQMVQADFLVNPSVVFTENNAGGVGGGVGGSLLGLVGGNRHIAAVGSVLGGVKFKEAATSLTMVDARSGIQVAAAQGSASKTDFSLGGMVWGSSGGASLGGYTNTNEGKMIVASFVDNWNQIVRAIRNSPSLVQAKAGPASQANAARSVQADAAAEGDVLMPRIAGAKLLKLPQEGAPELGTLAKGEELMYLGEERNGYLKVTGARGDGWVRKVMVRKQ